jgi:hypothetical protein
MILALDLAGLTNARPAATATACASKTTTMIIITPTIGTGRTYAL